MHVDPSNRVSRNKGQRHDHQQNSLSLEEHLLLGEAALVVVALVLLFRWQTRRAVDAANLHI